MNRKPLFIIALLLVAAATTTSTTFNGLLPASAHEGHNDAFVQPDTASSANAEALKPFTLPLESQQAIGLAVQTVQAGSLAAQIKVTGEVQAADTGLFDITPRVNGVVQAVLVKPGDRVKSGQVMAILSSNEVSTVLGQLLQALVLIHAERQHLATQIRGDIGVQTNDERLTDLALKREKALLSEGIAARKDYLDAQTAYQNAQVKRRTLQQRLAEEQHHYVEQRAITIQAAKSQLAVMGLPGSVVDRAVATEQVEAHVPIVAPASGTVSFRDITLGQTVAPGKRVFSVVQLRPIWVILDVPQTQATLLQPGQGVQLVTANGALSRGIVDSVGIVIDPLKRTLPVRVVSSNETEALKPQMFVTATIATRAAVGGRFLIPTSALLEPKGPPVVLVKEGNHFQPVRVTVSQQDTQQLEVTAGLFAGDQVVVQGVDQIRAQQLIARGAAPPTGDDGDGGHSHTATNLTNSDTATAAPWWQLAGIGLVAGMALMAGLTALFRFIKHRKG